METLISVIVLAGFAAILAARLEEFRGGFRAPSTPFDA